MTIDSILVGLTVAVLALFGASLVSVSIYARSTPQPRSRALVRAKRPNDAGRPLGPYRRCA
jgi:hypothetical protein